MGLKDAEELAILGHWFVGQCGGAVPVVSRLSRKLARMGGIEDMTRLLRVVQDMTGAALNDQQKEALGDVQRAFKV